MRSDHRRGRCRSKAERPDATANYLVYLDGDHANTANNAVGTEGRRGNRGGGAPRQAIDGRRPAARASSDHRPGMVRVTVTY